MKQKKVYYYKLVTHAGHTYIVCSTPDRYSGKILGEFKTKEQLLDFIEVNQYLIQEIK